MSKLLVFLGNPGPLYKLTRHNAGWMVCSAYTSDAIWQKKFHGEFQKNGNTILLKPQTYMNDSGISVQETAKFFGIKVQDIIVVHDDIELKFGEVKYQLGGGLGEHNGLRSIKQHMGSNQFGRLRIGVGRPLQMDVASWVLGRFSQEEEANLSDVFSRACDILNSCVR